MADNIKIYRLVDKAYNVIIYRKLTRVESKLRSSGENIKQGCWGISSFFEGWRCNHDAKSWYLRALCHGDL